MKILIIGNGYIGNRCADVWGSEAEITSQKFNTVSSIYEKIIDVKPDVVLNAAGVKGRPNVDWCETHQTETAFGNVILPINIADACASAGVYMLHISSGCIFYGASPDPEGWREDDFANPVSYYSKSKYAADLVLSGKPNVGIARIRIPLDDHSCSGNIVDKLASYPKIIDVANSISVVPDMIDVFYKLLEKRAEGVFHVTNPGMLKYRDLMSLYGKLVNPNHSNEWITEEQLVSQGLVAKCRSTNQLKSTRLAEFGIEMPEVNESVKNALKQYYLTKKPS